MRSIKIAVTAIFAAAALCFCFWGSFTENAAGSARVAGLSAPTGVIASDNQYINKISLYWSPVRGATTYSIFRNSVNDSSTAVQVGTTAAGYFFDTNLPIGQPFFYWIKAANTAETSGFSTVEQGSTAVGQLVNGSFTPLAPPPIPANNPMTASKAALGKALFWDEQLSATGTVACGTCHRPAAGGSDPRTALDPERSRHPGPDGIRGTVDDMFGSPGVPANNADGVYTVDSIFGTREQVTNRRAPTYLNAGYNPAGTFWDGRATREFRDPLTNNVLIATGASLESQSLFPPLSTAEMAHAGANWTSVAARVQASRPLALASNVPAGLSAWIDGRSYPELFAEVFGTPEVTPARIAMAIATHERMLFSDQTPLDRSATEIEELTLAEANGRDLFTALRCNFCHSGSLFTDNQFHNIGVRPQTDDLGRGGITGLSNDRGAFKTPNLRNVELRAPYMHNGRFKTLEEVIEFYNRGGDHDAPNINRGVILPLALSPEEKATLVAFLKRPLTDERVRNELPPFDRPTLFTESSRVPVVDGRGRPGTKRLIPEALVISPPMAGFQRFTLSVAAAYGGAEATLVIDQQDPGLGLEIPSSGSFARQTITLSGTGPSYGFGSVSLSIPNDPQLIGQKFYGRWYVKDKYAMGGIAVSKLITFTIF